MAKRNADLTVAMAKRISSRRRELKLTQKKAAALIGLSPAYYACIERGLKGVGADSIIKICAAFQISADYLLNGHMPPSERQYINQLMECLTEDQRTCAEEIMKNFLIACGHEIPEK